MTSRVRIEGGPHTRDIRVTVDGVPLQGVTGFKLEGSVKDGHGFVRATLEVLADYDVEGEAE